MWKEWRNFHGHYMVSFGEKLLVLDVPTRASVCRRTRLHVYHPGRDDWTSYSCGGFLEDLPLSQSYTQVVGNTLYVFIACDLEFSVHALNLKNINLLRWKQLPVSGVQPLPSKGMTSWVWQGKIYFFGGSCLTQQGSALEQRNVDFEEFRDIDRTKSNNQFVAFNPRTRCWEWPECSAGQPPSPRAYSQCIVSGDHMILLGGQHILPHTLHTLHMPSLSWSSSRHERELSDYSECTAFSAIGVNKALMFMESPVFDRDSRQKCWLLTWTFEKHNRQKFQLKRLPQQDKGLFTQLHIAHYSPTTSRICVARRPDGRDDYVPPGFLVNPQSLLEAGLCSAYGRHRSWGIFHYLQNRLQMFYIPMISLLKKE